MEKEIQNKNYIEEIEKNQTDKKIKKTRTNTRAYCRLLDDPEKTGQAVHFTSVTPAFTLYFS